MAGGVFVALSGLLILGLGLSTLFYDELLRYGPRWVFKFNESWWGSLHVVLGALMILAGVAAMSGARWAIVSALALALGSTVLMIIWLAYYPLWTVPPIILGVLALIALTIADPTMRRRIR
nr:hypothetical protein [Mycobacterium sp. OAS707]